MPDDAPIHLRVPAGLKARWVRESRAAGMRLTDWIIERVGRSMPTQIIAIPAGMDFSELKLARDPVTGDVSFDWAPIERICSVSGVDIEAFRSGPEDNLAGLLTAWYRAHLSTGGAPDPVYQDLIGEVDLEDRCGHGMSHQPGRA